MLIIPQKAVELGLLIPSGFSKFSPVGLDLSVCNITRIIGGAIFTDKSEIEEYEEMFLDDTHGGRKGWYLYPGSVFSITFNEHIKLDGKHTAFVMNRSSLLRSGSFISTGVFDPGFTSQLGCTVFSFRNMFIEQNSRIAQIIIHENEEVIETYNGQYQGTKDKK